jgi:hypothetical protein
MTTAPQHQLPNISYKGRRSRHGLSAPTINPAAAALAAINTHQWLARSQQHGHHQHVHGGHHQHWWWNPALMAGGYHKDRAACGLRKMMGVSAVLGKQMNSRLMGRAVADAGGVVMREVGDLNQALVSSLVPMSTALQVPRCA